MVLLKTKPPQHPAANLCRLRPPYYQSDMAPHRREISLDAIHSYGKGVDPLKLLVCLAKTEVNTSGTMTMFPSRTKLLSLLSQKLLKYLIGCDII
jgi:hypothetical protein